MRMSIEWSCAMQELAVFLQNSLSVKKTNLIVSARSVFVFDCVGDGPEVRLVTTIKRP